MKSSGVTDEQIVRTLQEADRDPVPRAGAGATGVSGPSIDPWRNKLFDRGADELILSEATRPGEQSPREDYG